MIFYTSRPFFSRLFPVFAGLVLCLAMTTASPPAAAGEDFAATLRALSSGDQRSAGNIARNQYRHPVKTLLFFGLAPDSTVIELSPGGGWYTEIIAPAVNATGHYIAAGYDPSAERERTRKAAARFAAKLAARPDLYGGATVRVFAPEKRPYGPPGSADLVLTFRNLHNWLAPEMSKAVFARAYQVLKPGGHFGFVDHRTTAARFRPKAHDGYVSEDYVKKAAAAAGFRFVAASEINANPKDTKDYAEGVWTLPPTLALKDKDRARYRAIGESDRMTLLFVKPE